MDLHKHILEILRRKGSVRTAEIVQVTGFSRAYVHRILQKLTGEGKLVLVGKANTARYLPASKRAVQKAKAEIRSVRRILKNKGLSEDQILSDIKRETGIFTGLRPNVQRILDYAFTEMLNNAIEHSRSDVIVVRIHRTEDGVLFRIADRGIGIFRNIMKQRRLASELEAIQDLLKGKQTTDPKRHSGEGIFFTSKAVDRLLIAGSNKRLIFDNLVDDVFVRTGKTLSGTDVEAFVSARSKKGLKEIFAAYTGETFHFGTTSVRVSLYTSSEEYISRSQARRLLVGLEQFRVIIIDFRNVETVGQGFADEVFRVWQRRHPDIKLDVKNANENVRFMIGHVTGGRGEG